MKVDNLKVNVGKVSSFRQADIRTRPFLFRHDLMVIEELHASHQLQDIGTWQSRLTCFALPLSYMILTVTI